MPPSYILGLLQNKHYMHNIRVYNSMFSMTSFGAKVDEGVNRRPSPYTFKVSGQISHRIGSFCPERSDMPCVLQLHVYDTKNEVGNRLWVFGDYSQVLQADFFAGLSLVLNGINEYVRVFRNALCLARENNLDEYSVCLYNNVPGVRYGRPYGSALGAIVTADDPNASNYDVIVHYRGGHLTRISKLHYSYMSLQYPLLFPYGEKESRLDFIRNNQNNLRCEHVSGIYDAISQGDSDAKIIGKQFFLSASFTGGPHYMYKHYQDALAICRVYGNPQYFDTFTCNVNWPEITRYMVQNDIKSSQDRPDINSRIFQIKVAEFIGFLKKDKPSGEMSAYLYNIEFQNIEFQNRGLPHCHTLVWVSSSSQIRSPIDVGYVHYKRNNFAFHTLDNGKWVDNGFVVPYNRRLCSRFNAHINVESFGWNMLIKYLFKYISKGVERVSFAIQRAESASTGHSLVEAVTVDEIQNFVDGRFICPHEAAWRLFNFFIHERFPSVQILAVHLENMQNTTFRDNDILQSVIRNPKFSKTRLTGWLLNNRADVTGMKLKYSEYSKQFRWDLSLRKWVRRTSNKKPAVSRLAYIHPTYGELLYLWMLLCHQSGCKTFFDIRKVNGIVYPSFRLACEALGLIGDDREWQFAFDDASLWASSQQLRSLFCHLLLFCDVIKPLQMWEYAWSNMSDDLRHEFGSVSSSRNVSIPDEAIQQQVLLELEKYLNSCTPSKTLSDFQLPIMSSDVSAVLRNRLLLEESGYDKEALRQ